MIQSILAAVVVVEEELAVGFKQAYVPVVMGFAWYMKHHLALSNKVIPLAVLALAVAGECISTLLTGGTVGHGTILAGLTWGFGMVGIHSGVKNLFQLFRSRP
jgi:hypothetical protein